VLNPPQTLDVVFFPSKSLEIDREAGVYLTLFFLKKKKKKKNNKKN